MTILLFVQRLTKLLRLEPAYAIDGQIGSNERAWIGFHQRPILRLGDLVFAYLESFRDDYSMFRLLLRKTFAISRRASHHATTRRNPSTLHASCRHAEPLLM